MFEAFVMLPFIGGVVDPFLYAETMLYILKPLSCVIRPIYFSVNSLSMRFIILPLSFVDVSISVYESASSIGTIINPIPFIESEIFPDLFSLSISHSIIELSDVPDAILQCDGSLGDEGRRILIVVLEWT